MALAELPLTATGDRDLSSSPWREDLREIDGELGVLHRRMHESRDNWRSAEAIDPAFEDFLATLTRTASVADRVPAVPFADDLAERENSWRTTLEAWERIAG